MAEDKEKFVLNGYQFEDEKDYKDALNEKKGVKYLNEQLDLNDTPRVRKLYDELQQKKMFHTPIGIEYMRKLRSTLLKQPGMDPDVPLVYVPASARTDDGKKSGDMRAQDRADRLESELTRSKNRNRTMSVVVLIMAITIIAMFIIAAYSRNKKVDDVKKEYAEYYERVMDYEDELNAREAELNAREAELNAGQE